MSKPLQKYDIDWFTYRKSYTNGSRVLLTTTPDHLSAFLENKFYLSGNLDAQPDLYQNQIVLFAAFPNQQVVQWARENFRIYHGISLIRKYDHYTEFFSFATSADNPQALNFCINNLDFLQGFCDHFLSQGESLLAQAESQQIFVPYHTQTLKCHDNANISELPGRNLISISARQSECIRLLLQGKSAKEMSAALNLSQRTVEAYINILKSKFKVRTKAQLIIKLLNFHHLCLS
ncbi:response regulator transcription factor [Aquicella siphonis]|nr:helix-turn-helix transcriptional regulator [Aquicella siphonis]